VVIDGWAHDRKGEYGASPVISGGRGLKRRNWGGGRGKGGKKPGGFPVNSCPACRGNLLARKRKKSFPGKRPLGGRGQ